jgi:hypothetical protein
MLLHRVRERAHVFELARLAVRFRKSMIFSAHAPRSFMHLIFAQLSWAILILVFRVTRNASTLTRALPLGRSGGTPDQAPEGRALADMCSNLVIALGIEPHLNTRPWMCVTQWCCASDTFGIKQQNLLAS